MKAKRAVPQPVEDLVYGNLSFSANSQGPGFVRAVERSQGNKVIWNKAVYAIVYKSDLERDVQDIFIKKLHVEGDTLIVENEKGQVFKLNPYTGERL